MLIFLIVKFFNDFCHTYYLNIGLIFTKFAGVVEL